MRLNSFLLIIFIFSFFTIPFVSAFWPWEEPAIDVIIIDRSPDVNGTYGEMRSFLQGTHFINPLDSNVVAGTIVSGSFFDLFVTDGTPLVVSETAAPIIDMNFNGLSTAPKRVDMFANYNGSVAHRYKIMLFDFDTNSYVDLTTETTDFPSDSSGIFTRFTFDANEASGNFKDDSGKSALRIEMTMGVPNVDHNFSIDAIVIDDGAINFTGIGTFQKLTNVDEGLSRNVDINAVDGTFTILEQGVYQGDLSINYNGTLGTTFVMAVFVNDVRQDNFFNSNFTNGSPSDILGNSTSGLLDLNVGDVVDFRVTAIEDTFMSIISYDFEIIKIVGDIPSNPNLWRTFDADTGSTTANTPTDIFTFVGGAGIDTSISGDNLTITATGGGGAGGFYFAGASLTLSDGNIFQVNDNNLFNVLDFTKSSIFNAAFNSDFNINNIVRLLQDSSCDNNVDCLIASASLGAVDLNLAFHNGSIIDIGTADAGGEFLNIDIIRSGTDTQNPIDIDITDTTTSGTSVFFDVDVTVSGGQSAFVYDVLLTQSNAGSGRAFRFDIQASDAARGQAFDLIVNSVGTGSADGMSLAVDTNSGTARGLDITVNSTNGGNVFGMFLQAGDSGSSVASTMVTLEADSEKTVAGSTITNLLLEEFGSEVADIGIHVKGETSGFTTGLKFTGTEVTAIDFNTTTITNHFRDGINNNYTLLDLNKNAETFCDGNTYLSGNGVCNALGTEADNNAFYVKLNPTATQVVSGGFDLNLSGDLDVNGTIDLGNWINVDNQFGIRTNNGQLFVRAKRTDGLTTIVDLDTIQSGSSSSGLIRLFRSSSGLSSGSFLIFDPGTGTQTFSVDASSGDINLPKNGDLNADVGTFNSLSVNTASALFVSTFNLNPAAATFTNAAGDFAMMWQNEGINALGVAISDDDIVRLVLNNGHDFAINAGTTEIFRVTPDGNVGINVGQPIADLEIGNGNYTIPAVFTLTAPTRSTLGLGGSSQASFMLEGSTRAAIFLDDSGGAANQQVIRLANEGGFTKFIRLNDSGSTGIDNIISINMADGNIGFGVADANATVQIGGDLLVDTNLTVTQTSFGGRNVFSAYDAAGSAPFTTTPIDINMAGFIRVDDFYTHTFLSDNYRITIGRTGEYMVSADCSIDVSSGVARSVARCYITQNGSEITGTRCFTYNRIAGNGDATCSINRIIDLDAGDEVTLQVVRHTGSDTLIATINGSRLNLEWYG